MAATTDLKLERTTQQLQWARDAVLWKLDGLPEHDVRRPAHPHRDQPARDRCSTSPAGSWPTSVTPSAGPTGCSCPGTLPATTPTTTSGSARTTAAPTYIRLCRAASARAAEPSTPTTWATPAPVPWWPGSSGSRCTRCWCACSSTRPGTPGTRTSCARTSTVRSAAAVASTPCPTRPTTGLLHRDRVERAAVAEACCLLTSPAGCGSLLVQQTSGGRTPARAARRPPSGADRSARWRSGRPPAEHVGAGRVAVRDEVLLAGVGRQPGGAGQGPGASARRGSARRRPGRPG